LHATERALVFEMIPKTKVQTDTVFENQRNISCCD